MTAVGAGLSGGIRRGSPLFKGNNREFVRADERGVIRRSLSFGELAKSVAIQVLTFEANDMDCHVTRFARSSQ